ncbi:DUF397 domain-containing protein [Kitasatospora kifunensis]|uniref:DUF397 domain-containing protein n=1 Tax=Kitasatospora kifunensis TaxID=58351 RepID=A0A7W7R612_KITKI|nr:DUF397 domain-containing protein [Kitasatospora kifunensis]MBB4925894.1 hypothetical protein [Kitasatospora kifunensis]
MSTAELAWFKSSYSNAEGGNCIEIAWTKSTHSNDEGGNCVEVATTPACPHVHVRDSKDKAGPQLAFSPANWAAFLTLATTL